ncbi:hypothetical protein N7489_003527 [Penicillium chrysogenum]|uniref:uncharacterized protein n=1 Tax=Penicillium chrysogenum TaxID=5076 RepID=UPI0024DF1AF3|nr:uncharacterized protein N7489_003527 [Penicillium chrysogenum]KAJ5253117.1 hypothetical protein N7489_003527 [Penicillium chrysogenum]
MQAPRIPRFLPLKVSRVPRGVRSRSLHARATEFLQSQDPDLSESQRTVREAISKICSDFPDSYWAQIDESHQFPTELYEALARRGWLGICLPQRYGGSELGISEAAVMMQTIAESGAGMTGASSIHMNIFGLEPVAKYGTEEQKDRWLTPLIAGRQRACFGVTEPNTGLDTLQLQATARRSRDGYVLSGQKVWISTAQRADKILILVRTTPRDRVKKPSQGLSLFYTDLQVPQVQITEIPKMGRAAVDTNSLFFDNWHVSMEDRVGEENEGFRMILHGMNAERILIGAEALGLGFAALRRAALYSNNRHVFGRPIGQNQGIQHPLADSWMKLEAARMMIYQAARLYDQGYTGGEYANAGKYLAAEAAFEGCERAILTHGGMGYAKEYHVERYLREVFIPRIAPVRPFCTQILADYGAEVLKVEHPKGGDDTRLWRTAAEKHVWKSTGKDMSTYFCAINRNKLSITLNLKQEKGREILFRLVKEADVVVENFVPGKMDEMGIGYEKLREINPSIIYASVSGYGASGPYSHRAGYDAIAAAEAGMLYITGERNGPPTRPGLGLTDMSTGLYLHGAILAALYARRDTGRGQKIDTSLFESQVSLLSNVAMSWLNGGEDAKRWGTEHPSIVPYQAFKTKDGHLVLGATNNRQFQTLCRLVKLSELATDPRFVDNSSRVQNRAELKEILEPIIRRKPTKVWLSDLNGSGLPYGPVNTIEEVFSHPQTAARDMVHSLPHEASESGEIRLLVGRSPKFDDLRQV